MTETGKNDPAAENEPTQFIIGTEVACNDGDLEELTRVVVDPIARAITHLVIEPKRGRGTGHLVPIELVAWAREDEIRLRCTASGFFALDEAEETHFVPGASGAWNYQQSQMLTLPYYQLGAGGMGGVGDDGGQHAVISDVTPVGEIDVRRGEHVHATDGAIGRVQGLVVDPGDHSVTHVLLDERADECRWDQIAADRDQDASDRDLMARVDAHDTRSRAICVSARANNVSKPPEHEWIPPAGVTRSPTYVTLLRSREIKQRCSRWCSCAPVTPTT
jgi:hypothetical protein